MGKKLYYIENISGILIILVVVGHYIGLFTENWNIGYYLYILPFFFYKSGMLSS